MELSGLQTKNERIENIRKNLELLGLEGQLLWSYIVGYKSKRRPSFIPGSEWLRGRNGKHTQGVLPEKQSQEQRRNSHGLHSKGSKRKIDMTEWLT